MSILKSRLAKINSESNKNVLTLLTGTSLAQGITIAISPILTRLYSPTEFGVFALFVSLAMLFSTISSLKYELAINLQIEDDDAFSILFMCVMITLIFSILLMIIILNFSDNICELLNNNEIKIWLYVLPVSVFLLGVYNSLSYWHNRKKNYLSISKSRVIRSLSVGGGQLCFNHIASTIGLISGVFIGQIVSLVYLLRKIEFKKVSLKKLRYKLYLYKKFALLKTPSTCLEVISSQLPMFLLTPFFGPAVVGSFSISQKFVRGPIQIIASSISDVFRQKACLEFSLKGDVRKIFLNCLLKLILISIVPFTIFYLYSPEIFSFVFGSEWYAAGIYAKIMVPMYWLSFIVGPMSVMFIIAEKQEYDLVIQILLLVFSCTAFYLGHYYFNNVEITLKLFTLVYVAKYLIELLLSYRFCIKP